VVGRAGRQNRANGRGAVVPNGELPPGQERARGWPVLHYGPVPRFRCESWDLNVFGATASGAEARWSFEEFTGFPRVRVAADLHCVTRFSVLGNVWQGVAAATILRAVPPAPGVTHVMVWAEYGYGANMTLEDFAADTSLFADYRNGERLSPEHGRPLRFVVPHLYAWKGPKWVRGVEYLSEDRRGFWEERGYHNLADPWVEQRYSYQESPGDGPAL
jgi:DMSO/TMAO reductase YedYZ molybdopterin-dependent catalytic subunit